MIVFFASRKTKKKQLKLALRTDFTGSTITLSVAVSGFHQRPNPKNNLGPKMKMRRRSRLAFKLEIDNAYLSGLGLPE